MSDLSSNEEFLKSAFKGKFHSFVKWFICEIFHSIWVQNKVASWFWYAVSFTSMILWLTKWKILSGYDINGDGKVTVKEFKRIMARTGEELWCFFCIFGFLLGKMSEEEIVKMIEKTDVDSDG